MLTFASSFIAEKLSKFIIGQKPAIEEIASAICENYEDFLTGKAMKSNNILLMGPTGSGKTEIARNISKVLNIPFLKTNASDFTLTGYKGRDPQEIVSIDFRDVLNSKNWIKDIEESEKKYRIHKAAIEIFKRELQATGGSPFEFFVALEFAASSTLFKKREVIRFLLKKYKEKRDIVKNTISVMEFILNEVERNFFFEEKTDIKARFKQKPLGLIFIDEIDKILINERDGDREGFYRHLQNFMLTMIEGSVITHEEGSPIDTSHITFALAGAFHISSPEEFIPEFLGRLNCRVKLRKLRYSDYLEIARLHGIEIPEILRDIAIKVDDEAIDEIAKICEELNEQEYLGARRLREIVSKVNSAIKREVSSLISGGPLIVDRDFIRWAVFFNPLEYLEERTPKLTKLRSLRLDPFWRDIAKSNKSNRVAKLEKEKLRASIIDSAFNKVLIEATKFFKKEDRLQFTDKIANILQTKNSIGQTVFEVLIQKGVIKELYASELELLKETLGEDVIQKVINKVTLLTDPEDIEF
jgi:ATP-dependent HslUV protease ATP-binding subunit HslU